MSHHRERGMATAEYTVGTLGAVMIAFVLFRIGGDGWFFDQVKEIIQRALRPGVLVDLIQHIPRIGRR